jgi:BASS family bile acid:Na+ symporter
MILGNGLASGLGLIRNSSFIFTLAVIIGLIYPGFAELLEPTITPILLIIMILSMIEIDLSARGDLSGAVFGLFINYLFLSGTIIVLSSFVGDESIRQGFIVMAAVPPAVAVLPLTKILGGDSHLSLYSETICYLASLVIMPAIIFAFTSKTGTNFAYVAEIALLLILMPIIASRFLKDYRLDTIPPINLGFFLVTYTVLGLNREAILGDVSSIALIAFARTFLTGMIVYIIAKLAGVQIQKRISYTLFASFKNLGMAAAVAIALFGPRAGIPAAVCVLAETLFYIVFAFFRRHGSLI